MATRRENKLRIYWDEKEDVMKCGYPQGVGTADDAQFLSEVMDVIHEQLIMRGYDLTTMKFEISPDFNTVVPSQLEGIQNRKKFDQIK